MHRHPPKVGFSLLSQEEVRFIEALADTHFPPGNALGVSGGDVGIAKGVDQRLGGMGPEEQTILRSLLALIDRWPQINLSGLRRFSELSLDKRIHLLKYWEDSHSDAKRGLAELLRTVVSLHYFEDPRVLAAMGLQFGCPEIPL